MAISGGTVGQEGTDKANRDFWNELCGSNAARALGIKDHSPESLKRFDDYYLGFYPYLPQIIRPNELKGRKVLEVGLGYGTVGQKIAERGARYTGMDIAEGPVRMMRGRLRVQGMNGRAIQGSMLDAPFASASMDAVVSIGCFHHTGNLRKCLEETRRILKPGGVAVIMVYNQFSLRQWINWPGGNLRALARDFGVGRGPETASEDQKKAYDAGGGGEAAPETVFSSISQLNKMLSGFSRVTFRKENCDDLYLRGRLVAPRHRLLPTLGRLMGLDIYIRAVK
ncbi:MAG: class I SAM-dependent methyltransferase [Nitrospinae bacterium]|nr:class I SAM-dependent methyltransferase [Nitrospinota bacterium]